ncbi:DUF488 domain-containing protein [Tessaracoccus terricola]
MTIFTIGHSNRPLQEFTDLLREHDIALVVDVRRLPGSKRNPWFNDDALAASLADLGIDYRWSQGLTGRRRVSKDVPFEVNAWWENRSFHNYADHALGAEFREALEELLRWAPEAATAVMCSEAVWWRCHRRLIADHLLARGIDVRHIVGPGRAEPARLSEGAVVSEGDVVKYPAEPKS